MALSQAVPFVGFGLCDNAVMIMAGESIETALGVGLGLSTMAAAGFGNTVSDVVGIGLSSKIETFAERLGFQAPQNLTQAQRMTAAVRWAKVAGATGGGHRGMSARDVSAFARLVSDVAISTS